MYNVDTLTLGTELPMHCINIQLEEYLKSKLKREYNKSIKCYCYKGRYKDYSFYYIPRYYYLLITLQHNRIKRYTHNEIMNTTISFIANYFKIPKKHLQNIKLNRIDYKTDYYCKCDEEKFIINDILKIAPSKIGKSYCKNIIKNRFVSYTSKTKEDYEGNSKGSGYFSLTAYDKEEERLDKQDLEGSKEYENIFRTEIKIKNKKLNSSKHSIGITKDLENYYDMDMAKMYFDYYVPRVYFTESFYRIDIAIQKINNTDFPRESMKTKLIDLLNDIQVNGYTNVKEKYKWVDVFKSHINKIRDIGINPLTYSTNYKTKIMDNFSLLENDVSESKNHLHI